MQIPVRSASFCLWSLLSVARLAAQPTIVEYTIPTSASGPGGITAGPDGNLWFVETAANKIGKITTAGSISEYSIPTADSGPTAITQGADGNLWFIESSTTNIGRITTSGTITEFSHPNLNQAAGITLGPDGNVWFSYGSGVGKITPVGAITLYPVSFGFPGGIVTGPDGNLWFANFYATGARPGTLGKITISGTITQVSLSTGFATAAIASGPDGEIWFGGDSGGLGSITTAGLSMYYGVPGGAISSIAVGPDGNLWLTQYAEISRMTPGLALTQYPITAAGIASGPDGNIWFTEYAGNKIAKLVLSTVPAPSLLTISPSSFSFTGEQGGAAPAPQTLSISSPSPTTFTTSSNVPQSWLSITPSGTLTTNQTISVSVNQSANLDNLPVGNNTGTIALSTAAVTQYVPLTFTVTAASSQIMLEATPTVLTFTYPTGGAVPASQTLQVIASGSGSTSVPITAAASSVGNWLSVTPSGTTPATLTVSVVPSGLSPGAYLGSITISGGGGAAGRSVTVSVELQVQPAPAVEVSTAGLTFTAQPGGPAPAAQTFMVTASSPTTFTLTVVDATPWLTVSPTGTLTTNQTITVIANPAGLGACACGTFIRIAFGSSTVNVPVNFNVTAPPAVNVSPNSLAFAYQVGGAAPQAQTVAVSEYGVINGQQAFTAAVASGGTWLSVSPTSGTTTATLAVRVSPTGLAPGVYNGSVSVTPTGGSAASVPVTLTVTATTLLSANPNAVSFTYAQGASAPGSQSIQVSSAGSGSVAFTATSNASWLTVSPQSGTAPVFLTVSASVNGLGIGAYGGAISITPAGGSPLSIPVNLVITAPVTLLPSPSTLNFTYSQGGSAPPAQLVQIPSPSGGSVAFTTSSGASWLTVSPLSGSTPATLTVTVAGTLAAGTYSGTVSVTVGGHIAASVLVTATVGPPAAAGISVNPPSLTFTASEGSTAALAQPILLSASGGTAVGFTVAASSAGNWLSVSPSSGSTPSTLVVSASPTGLSPGSYSGKVSVSGGALNIPVTLTVTQPALPTITGVVNAASFAAGAISPGALISIVGTNLGPAAPANLTLDANGNVATSLGGVKVLVGGKAAPLIYASSTQINAVVPYEIAGLLGLPVSVTYQGQGSNGFNVEAAPAAPGIFTQTSSGVGPGAILNQDYTLNGPANPAPRGSIVTIFMTGEGQTSPSGVDGWVTVPSTSSFGPITPAPVLPVSATLAGQPATVQFAGEAPGTVSGVLQVNLQIPANAPTGNLAIVVSIGNINSQAGVTISVQ